MSVLLVARHITVNGSIPTERALVAIRSSSDAIDG
jgi:hypothetical protein